MFWWRMVGRLFVNVSRGFVRLTPELKGVQNINAEGKSCVITLTRAIYLGGKTRQSRRGWGPDAESKTIFFILNISYLTGQKNQTNSSAPPPPTVLQPANLQVSCTLLKQVHM